MPLKKELENDQTVTYKIRFNDGLRFMSSSLSSLADNLAKGLHSSKCTDCKSLLEYTYTKDEDKLLIFNCLNCNKNYDKDFEIKI